jgi:hypothetical protein
MVRKERKAHFHLGLIGGLAWIIFALAGGQACAFTAGEDQYPYSIMAPEPGSGPHHGAAANSHRRHGKTVRAPVKPSTDEVAKPSAEEPAGPPPTQTPPRRVSVVRGSSGSVLPTPLPRTRLIPPEGGRSLTLPNLPQQQGNTVIPGSTIGIPNLPHGTETFQDRASRCAHQAGVYGVPGNTTTQYMAACAM